LMVQSSSLTAETVHTRSATPTALGVSNIKQSKSTTRPRHSSSG
jgi:hypothetical protein